MDYKQKYEQLAKFIKDLYPHMSDYCKEKTEGMIPELKESEDEEVIKFIKKQLFNIKEKFTVNYELNAKLTKAIDWLEKQGEQKPVNKPITDAQIIVKQLLLFLETPSKYNPDAIVEQSEVDLEKEIKSFTEDLFHKVFDEDKSQDDFDWDDITTVIEYTAKYFVELGIQKSNHNKNEEKSYRNHFIDWQRNTDINKPTKNHSILMQTTHGIAEGEWNGEKWIQYRWNSLLKDKDVLAWIELSNIEIPPSISLNLN